MIDVNTFKFSSVKNFLSKYLDTEFSIINNDVKLSSIINFISEPEKKYIITNTFNLEKEIKNGRFYINTNKQCVESLNNCWQKGFEIDILGSNFENAYISVLSKLDNYSGTQIMNTILKF